ncbi:AIPR family protein [Microbulbifer aggregans]|uniref:AIPR family protein n=1 Tax=Microbulbifer aggregans TaxID=1769779 RepID=UPI001CFDD828|nr:AIPR family protein [Microbulbifer aggregans]
MDIDVDELLSCRENILAVVKDENGFIPQNAILTEVLPSLLDAKRVDSEDYNESYFCNEIEKLKVNAYQVNETGERLQIFIVDENSVDETSNKDDLLVSEKQEYEKFFKKSIKFIRSAISQNLMDSMQDSDPAKALVAHLSHPDGLKQFDVIEIFLVSLKATVTFKGQQPQPRSMRFPEDSIKVSWREGVETINKEILLIREIIDINFIFNVMASKGNREPLEVNFQKSFGYSIDVIEAASENNFQSYLCVLSADVLTDLYRRYSSRLLEKNVRSFLQFKGANKGIKETIRKEPEKFIAFNNGLTITATKAKVFEKRKRKYIEALHDLQIVNGGQTTASIYFSKKEGLDVSKVKVMAKINVVDDGSEVDDLVSKISKYSNTQSRVSNVDLRSRSPQLVRLKALSESVVNPQGDKWFFERARGDFNTKLRIAGSNSARLKREYPPERRFSKEQLAKYFSSWGGVPHLVKKGGEKIFRHFIEYITPGCGKPHIEIDRDFYERLVSLIIIFKRCEKIYGTGKNSMGQLRSAVIPYALAILYLYTDGVKGEHVFNMNIIWRSGKVPDDLDGYLESLLLMTNELIKKYSKSEDYGEYSKKEELWLDVSKSSEVKEFMSSSNSTKILAKYSSGCAISSGGQPQSAEVIK